MNMSPTSEHMERSSEFRLRAECNIEKSTAHRRTPSEFEENTPHTLQQVAQRAGSEEEFGGRGGYVSKRFALGHNGVNGHTRARASSHRSDEPQNSLSTPAPTNANCSLIRLTASSERSNSQHTRRQPRVTASTLFAHPRLDIHS